MADYGNEYEQGAVAITTFGCWSLQLPCLLLVQLASRQSNWSLLGAVHLQYWYSAWQLLYP